jgi:hypothetical protein
MQNDAQAGDAELRATVLRLGAQLGIVPLTTDTAVDFARRCCAAALLLRRSAGITWADYELIKADKGEAVFMLKKPPESSPLGGPRWAITAGQGLEELAGKLGMYEDGQ